MQTSFSLGLLGSFQDTGFWTCREKSQVINVNYVNPRKTFGPNFTATSVQFQVKCVTNSCIESQSLVLPTSSVTFLCLLVSCSSGTSQRTNVISCVTVHDSHDSDSSTSSPLSPKAASQPSKSLAVIMPSVKAQPAENTALKAAAASG